LDLVETKVPKVQLEQRVLKVHKDHKVIKVLLLDLKDLLVEKVLKDP
jgi:hypothetical protein